MPTNYENVEEVQQMSKKYDVDVSFLSSLLDIFGDTAIGRTDRRTGSVPSDFNFRLGAQKAKELLERVVASDEFVGDILDFALQHGHDQEHGVTNERLARFMASDRDVQINAGKKMIQQVIDSIPS